MVDILATLESEKWWNIEMVESEKEKWWNIATLESEKWWSRGNIVVVEMVDCHRSRRNGGT